MELLDAELLPQDRATFQARNLRQLAPLHIVLWTCLLPQRLHMHVLLVTGTRVSEDWRAFEVRGCIVSLMWWSW